MKLTNGTDMRHRLYKKGESGRMVWVIAHQARSGPDKPWNRIGLECAARPRVKRHRKCGGIVYTTQPMRGEDRVLLPIDICRKCGADVTERK